MDDGASVGVEVDPVLRKGRGKSRQWTSVGMFESLEAALQSIKSHPHWRMDPHEAPSTIIGGVVRRSSKDVSPDKMGVKKIRFACEFGNSYGCPVWWLVEDQSASKQRSPQSPGESDLHFELFSDGTQHNHSTYFGKQVDRTFKIRVESLAEELYPRKIRRLLVNEGMEVSGKMYDTIKGVRYRFLSRKYGDTEERDTAKAIHRLVMTHGMDITDPDDMQEMDLYETIFSPVEIPGDDGTGAIVVVTTPAQLLNAVTASTCGYNFGIHADGTHGLVLGEAQVGIIATHDIQQRGHRIAAIILPKAGCNTDLLTHVFKHLKSMVEAMAKARLPDQCLAGWEWNISRFLSDDEGAFRNAAKAVWGENLMIAMCYFHVLQNVKTTGRGKLIKKVLALESARFDNI